MLLRVPDEYVALTEYLERNGIPFEIVEEDKKNPLERLLEKVLKENKNE
jgi:hypothetical protein